MVDKHWLWGPLKANKRIYIQVILAAAFVNILSLGTSLFTMVVYDRVIPNNAVESLIALTIGMLIALSADFVLRSLRGYFIDVAGQRVDTLIGAQLFARVLDVRISTRKMPPGAFASRVREFETLRDFFTSATLVAVVDLPFIALFLFVIWAIGGAAVLVPLLAVPLVFVTGFLIQPALKSLADQSMEEAQDKHAVLVETVSGLETVKALGAGPVMAKRWRAAIAGHAQTNRRSRIFSQLAINVATSAQQIAQVGIVVAGVFLITTGAMSMGALIACVILTGRTLAPLSQIANVLSRINGARAAYQALSELMETDTDTRQEIPYVRHEKLDGAISFKNVSFRYPGEADWVLRGVNFDIQPGEKVAVLGKIGSGKSTLLRLMLGLYSASDGQVLVDDTDVRQIHPDDLRQNMGAVLQDVTLFSGSVRENILMRVPEASDADLLDVAKAAGVHDFIGGRPNGYHLRLSDRGEGLSGGQKQSIAIARALIGGPSILVMDEPTSAMDINTENALTSRLKPQLEDKTLILITHRGTLLKLVDKIILMDKGRVVSVGPRDDVLKSMAVSAGAAGIGGGGVQGGVQGA
ncbi:MAG: type I secretion system permease/ATPase [Pseudomonadota bacterium]